MTRKFEIPKMDKLDIIKWYSTIHPIVSFCGTPFYLRKLSEEEFATISYQWFNTGNDYEKKVDFSKLSYLADVKMLHTYSNRLFFEPTVVEIISQIPSHLLEKVFAFQIVYQPTNQSDFDLFSSELSSGYHVSIVRLYQEKASYKPAANKVSGYPTIHDTTPIGMSIEEFQNLTTKN